MARTSMSVTSLRRAAAAVVAVITVAAGIVVASPPSPAEAAGDFVFQGRGWGHGRGMGQYGALGYAVDHGWDYGAILRHYYGGTYATSDVGHPVLGVEITRRNGMDTIVTAAGMTLNGAPVGAAALRVERTSGGTFQVWSGPGCAGPWAPLGGPVGGSVGISPTGDPSVPQNLLQLCESGRRTYYRGSFVVVNSQGATQVTVNDVTLDDYLRGVVPRESPAAWGNLGNGRGTEALKAQAVAARSYALSSAPRPSGARVCDTTACQVYNGAYQQPDGGALSALEHPVTDTVVRATTGQVMRMPGGAIARTEFSSSTGGYTAGGTFPAVPDEGDATSLNPSYHTWTRSVPQSTVAAALGMGGIAAMDVTRRNGLGADGGRVVEVRVTATNGATRLVSGSTMRSTLGLNSDWFTISGTTAPAAEKLVRALYSDILGREPEAGGLAAWSDIVTRTGDTSPVASGIVMSTERLYTFVRKEYQTALRREPDQTGALGWVAALQQGMSVPELQVQVYASEEGYWVVGRNDPETWVSGVYQGILRRPAAPAERASWASAVATSGRQAVVRAIARSDEAALLRLDDYYRLMLGRSPDPSGIASFKPMMAGNGDFVLPIEIGRSREYYLRAQTRY